MTDVRLRPLHASDLGTITRWAADEVFCRAAGWRVGLSERALAAWFAPILAGGEPGFLRLGVEWAGALVGYVDLADLNAHSAEFGIILGERALWGQGLGVRAGRAMLTHGFGTLGLGVIRAEVHASNARSLRLMAKLGFQAAGAAGHLEMYQDAWTPVQRFTLRAEDWAG